MIRFKLLFSVLVAPALCGVGAYAQTSLTQTTLAAAVSIGPANLMGGTVTGSFQTQDIPQS